mmetsp:Transcript_33728/g.47942  ORF Transcript_33728/g.47942 Transcript_33728/m.47942 type:complete len:121 (-) Transcript_33728:33-395(-)
MPSVKATSEGKSKGKTKREISRSPSKMVSPFVTNVAIPVIIAGKSSVNREFSYHPSTEPTSFGESTNPLDSRGKGDFKSDEEDAESRIVEGRSEEHQGEISDAESLRLRKRRNRRMKHNM